MIFTDREGNIGNEKKEGPAVTLKKKREREKISAKCLSLNNHNLSAILPSKNGFVKKQLVCNSSNCTNAFPSDNHHTLVCSRNALPVSLHRISKRCILKSQELIKLVIFTASSRIFLSETFFVFFFPMSTWC